MDFQDNADNRGERDRVGGLDNILMNAVARQDLRFSNFLLTFSTNVVPRDDSEQDNLVEWLIEATNELFRDWETINGNCLKPPGTRNSQMARFVDPVRIVHIRARVSCERGQAQQGQVHCHVLLEVAHRYLQQEGGAEGNGPENGRPYIGVHTNVEAMREFLNDRINRMDIPENRRPPKIYVNSKLLTKGTDQSNKWLTLQYINKDRDLRNVDLRAQEQQHGTVETVQVRRNMLNGGLNAAAEHHEVPVDAAENDDNDRNDGGGSDDDNQPQPPQPPAFVNVNPQRAPPQAPAFLNVNAQAPAPQAPNFAVVSRPRLRSGAIPAMRNYK